MPSNPLGQIMQIHAIALRGAPSTDDRLLLDFVARRIGMTPAYDAAEWTYPTPDGQGGIGKTIVQPITQSFIAIDSWPALGGRYLVVCSCERFDIHGLGRALAGEGHEIRGRTGGIISIREDNK